MNKQLKQAVDGYDSSQVIMDDLAFSGELSLSYPLTQEAYDEILDIDFRHTYAVFFNTPKGGKVRFIREENVNEFIGQVITALQDINHALWGIDIPSPTVPEYIERHEQIQRVMQLVNEKLDAIREDAKRMEDDLK